MSSDTIERDPLDKVISGAKAIGEVYDRDEAGAAYDLGRGYIDATKKGAIWVSTPRRVLQSLGIKI